MYSTCARFAGTHRREFSACQAAPHTHHTQHTTDTTHNPTHTPRTQRTTHCTPSPAPTPHITTPQHTKHKTHIPHTLSAHTPQPFQHTRTTHDTTHTHTHHTHKRTRTRTHIHIHHTPHTILTPHISTQHQHNRQPTVILRRKSECFDVCTDAPQTMFLHTKKSATSVTFVFSCGHYCFWN